MPHKYPVRVCAYLKQTHTNMYVQKHEPLNSFWHIIFHIPGIQIYQCTLMNRTRKNSSNYVVDKTIHKYNTSLIKQASIITNLCYNYAVLHNGTIC